MRCHFINLPCDVTHLWFWMSHNDTIQTGTATLIHLTVLEILQEFWSHSFPDLLSPCGVGAVNGQET